MGRDFQGVDQRIWINRLDPEDQYWNNKNNTAGRSYMPRPAMQPRIFPTVKAERDLVGHEIGPNYP